MTRYRKKLIEVALPLDAINEASGREKSIRHGHPSTLHLWWARRPLAACRAVLFAQLVDDPSAWPERFPTQEAQERERQRLFDIIERLVPWEASTDEDVLNEARLEIARSWARSHPSAAADGVLAEGVAPKTVNDYLATEVPPVHDPFAGGGSIPLEAQRLGLRAIATDLNPVAVLINKALIEIPPRFAGMPPVNPEDRETAKLKRWRGAQGLAADVRYYGAWVRERAKERIGHLYPDVLVPEEGAALRPDLAGLGGKRLTVIAWLWARTVPSPDPAAGGAHVPLVSSFWLSKKKGKETWVEIVVSPDKKSYRFEVRTGAPADRGAVEAGTKAGRGSFRCALTGTPISGDHIKTEGMAGRMGTRLMAVVAEGNRRRVYLPPDDEQTMSAEVTMPEWIPDDRLPDDPRNFWTVQYGLVSFGDLFTPRQLVALTTFADLVSDARARARADALEAGMPEGDAALHAGGRGADAYADAVATYLGITASKIADAQSSLVRWKAARDRVITTFARHALPMVWDFAESNAFGGGSGDFALTAYNMIRVVHEMTALVPAGVATQADASFARTAHAPGARILSTDPPYYDNIGYADLSDFFYVWLRRTLRDVFPAEMATMLVPKDDELVATPYRHGGKKEAETFFLDGMTRAVETMCAASELSTPTTIYYAFKQAETTSAGTASTGWETFLSALVHAGFSVVGTWPIRTERGGRSISIGTNSLASSVVLVCRPRTDDPSITRGDLRRALREELPRALRALQHAGIAPVDVAQAAIGPGMAAFTRQAKVLEADGSCMTVRAALQLINEVLDEHLAESEVDYDRDTRWAITWFEHHGYEEGSYGEAESLAKARNVSVRGVADAGIVKSAAGKVRILRREEMGSLDYDPADDDRSTIWEHTQHLIRKLEQGGESAAAELLAKLGTNAETAKALAYRLYTVCERRKWADEARAYNGLVVAWPELERLAASIPAAASNPQREMFE